MRKDYISSRRIINRQLTVNIKRREIYQSPHDDISIPVTTSCLHKHTLVSRRLLDLGTISRAYYIIRLFKKKRKKEKKRNRKNVSSFSLFPVVLRFERESIQNANRTMSRYTIRVPENRSYRALDGSCYVRNVCLVTATDCLRPD